KWCVFCVVTGRLMAIDQDQRRYFAIGDTDRAYEDKLAEYRKLVDAHFEVERYGEFCAAALPAIRELTVDYFGSPQFDALLVDTVRTTFPAHEHEQMVDRHRGLVGAWVREQQAAE